jgi:hypothetical protein
MAAYTMRSDRTMCHSAIGLMACRKLVPTPSAAIEAGNAMNASTASAIASAVLR